MTSSDCYRVIKIDRHLYSYGFELKDEITPYRRYAVVSKITNDIASESGLRVGDRVVSINGENVAGKDYVSLRNNIRKSIDNCVVLEVLKDMEFQLMSPELSYSQTNFTPLKLSFGRTLIPSGSIREKIRLFQKTSDRDSNSSINTRSNSCDCINKCGTQLHTIEHIISNNITQISSVSVDNIMKNMELYKSELDIRIRDTTSQTPYIDDSLSICLDIDNYDLNHTISQDPFKDDALSISDNIVKIQMPSNFIRVMETKSTEHIESPLSLTSHDTDFELITEPFEDKPIKRQLIPKLEMPEFPYSYSIPGFDQLSPGFINIKSRSSHNLCGDSNQDWSLKSPSIKNCTEYGSMTDIKSANNVINYSNKKLPRQPSLLTNIPIKLRILQFHDRIKSKSWKDYIIEPECNGARFRKRFLENLKSDRTSNFIIRVEDVNQFEVESPHRRHKTSSGSDICSQESQLKYSLMAFNSRIHIKFHFNTTMFQDDQSSIQACSTFKTIIDTFKAADHKYSHSINPYSLSQSSSINLSLYDTQSSVNTMKEWNSSIEEVSNVDRHNSASNSCKSISKSSAENLSATTLEISQSVTSKNIFKQAMGKIKPEKKIKVTQTYEVFTGTKAEFEEFKRQLEGGHLPLELDSSDENGTHFNRYIYEVPRMNVCPKIPMIIYLCTEIVEKIGLKVEGIYRISGNQRVIRILSNTLNKSLEEIESNLPEWTNVHAVCGTLKLFLRKLKQYLIPADLSHVLAYSCKGVDCDNPRSLSKTLMDIRYHLSSYQIPSRRRSDSSLIDQIDCRWQSLQYILKHLAKVVSCRQFNNMDEHAVSVCFNPVIMESWQNNLKDIKADNEIMVKALELILVHQDWLFNNWHSEMDCSWSSELVDNAYNYARDFIDRKYSINIKIGDDDELIEEKDIEVNLLVEEIISKSTMNFEEKRKLGRRHSSHTPGQKSLTARDEVDISDTGSLRRNSQTTEALDLFTCTNWMKPFAKVPTIDENKEIKVTYIPSTEPNCDVFEPYVPDGRVLRRQVPLNRIAMDYQDRGKDIIIHPSKEPNNLDSLSNQRV